MVISEIRSLYQKRIARIVILYIVMLASLIGCDRDAVEQRHGWLIPPEWEFQSEVWEYERRSPVSETVYDHDSEVEIFR